MEQGKIFIKKEKNYSVPFVLPKKLKSSPLRRRLKVYLYFVERYSKTILSPLLEGVTIKEYFHNVLELIVT